VTRKQLCHNPARQALPLVLAFNSNVPELLSVLIEREPTALCSLKRIRGTAPLDGSDSHYVLSCGSNNQCFRAGQFQLRGIWIDRISALHDGGAKRELLQGKTSGDTRFHAIFRDILHCPILRQEEPRRST